MPTASYRRSSSERIKKFISQFRSVSHSIVTRVATLSPCAFFSHCVTTSTKPILNLIANSHTSRSVDCNRSIPLNLKLTQFSRSETQSEAIGISTLSASEQLSRWYAHCGQRVIRRFNRHFNSRTSHQEWQSPRQNMEPD